MTTYPALEGDVTLRLRINGSSAQLDSVLQVVFKHIAATIDKALEPILISEGVALDDWEVLFQMRVNPP